MLEAVVVGLLVICPLVGVITRRWLVVALPLAAWPLFYLGLNKDWWLHGTGDGWQNAARFFTLFGVATTALAVAIARAVRPPLKSRAHSSRRPQ